MDFEELKEHMMNFFGDTSRPASETKRDLLTLAEEARTLAETIEDDID